MLENLSNQGNYDYSLLTFFSQYRMDLTSLTSPWIYQREDSKSELLSDAKDKLGALVNKSRVEVSSRASSPLYSCLNKKKDHEGP